MANIQKMQMGKTICSDTRIAVSKSLLGLRTTVTYTPTNSIVDGKTLEYTPAMGDRVKEILNMPASQRQKAIGEFHPEPTVNGNYMAEVCLSRDHAFLAVQLLRFSQLSYEPVTDTLIFEGDEARALAPLF